MVRVIGMHTFGASAPLKDLQKKFGFEPDQIVAVAKDLLCKKSAARQPRRICVDTVVRASRRSPTRNDFGLTANRHYETKTVLESLAPQLLCPKRPALGLAFQGVPASVRAMAEAAEVTQVLHAIGRSEEGAAEKLLPLVYAELRRLAGARMANELAGQTLQPTALVHEAWLRLVKDGDRTWQNRAHFFGAAAEAMRRILIERARHRSRLKHGGGQARLNIEDLELAETTPDDKVLLVDEALARLKVEDPELERIVVLKFFGGLSNEEIAETVELSKRTLDRQWAYARAWLFRYISEHT
jgi:RNA polymerase sigma factor (TIGR02999 family)